MTPATRSAICTAAVTRRQQRQPAAVRAPAGRPASTRRNDNSSDHCARAKEQSAGYSPAPYAAIGAGGHHCRLAAVTSRYERHAAAHAPDAGRRRSELDDLRADTHPSGRDCHPRRVGDLAAPITSGSAVGASRPWGQIQLTIMKFCIRIRYPASSCAGATRSFRHVRKTGVRRGSQDGRHGSPKGPARRWTGSA
jgi:hypothetical protein